MEEQSNSENSVQSLLTTKIRRLPVSGFNANKGAVQATTT
jgi:hypothetical protein